MNIQLQKCIAMNILWDAWFHKRATLAEVIKHRENCDICKENMRLCNLQAKAIRYPEEVEAAV